MWFKNLLIYQLQTDFNYTPEQLAELLENHRAKPCAKTAPSSFGWDSPYGQGNDLLVHGAGGYLIFAGKREMRLLPGGVVRAALTEKIAAQEEAEHRKLSSKEKARLKDEITFDLLPRAFVQASRMLAYYDPHLKCLVIDTSSRSKAEELLQLLRESLGTLSVLPLQTNSNPAMIMTNWLLKGAHQPDFALDDRCEMQDPKQGDGIIKCQRQDLTAHEVQQHLEMGKQIQQLGLIWQEKITFQLGFDFSIKRIKCLELIKERLADEKYDTAMLQFDSEFALMTGELTAMLQQLLLVFDGIQTSDAKTLTKSEAVTSVN